MMPDIVARLMQWSGDADAEERMQDAAAEIERLRAENQVLHGLITNDAALIEQYNAAMDRYNLKQAPSTRDHVKG